MEAAPHGASGIPVFPERAGRHGSVFHALQSGKQSGLHVHPLRTFRQVREWRGSGRERKITKRDVMRRGQERDRDRGGDGNRNR